MVTTQIIIPLAIMEITTIAITALDIDTAVILQDMLSPVTIPIIDGKCIATFTNNWGNLFGGGLESLPNYEKAFPVAV